MAVGLRFGFSKGARYGERHIGKEILGTDRSEFILGSHGDDVIDGGGGNDIIFGRHGDDIITPGEGFDYVDGGRGDDTVVYQGAVEEYEIRTFRHWHARTVMVTKRDADGMIVDRDILKNVEALRFEADDYTLYLDGRNNSVLARDDAAATGEDDVLEVAVADLLANDSEYDGDVMTIVSVSATSAAGAPVSLVDGKVVYDPSGLFDSLSAGETALDTLTYTVDDGKGGTDTATLVVTVTGSNDAPEITSSATFDYAENSADVVATVEATDVEGDVVSYEITGGADADLFEIDPATGELRFLSSPNFEAPGDANADNSYEVLVTASDGEGGLSDQLITIAVSNVNEAALVDARINEIHYDNGGADVGEFVEIRTAAGDDVSALVAELYNGNNGAVYASVAVSSLSMTSDGTHDYYVWEPGSIQNGSSDGIALSNGGEIIEFLSYEGVLTAVDGWAAGMTSTDIGVSEGGGTPSGYSLQRNDDGVFEEARAETRGGANIIPVPEVDGRINEIHYDNEGADVGEFVEIRIAAGDDVSALVIELYNGNGGAAYASVAVSGLTMTSDGTYDYYVWEPRSIQNGGPDGLALSNGGEVIEFLSYEGTFTATSGSANGLTSTDIGVSETGSTLAGLSLQRNEDGSWRAPETATPGAANAAAADVVINEIAVSTSGTDWEFVELTGIAGLSLDGYALIQVDGDGEIRSVIDLDGQSIGENGYFLAASDQAEMTFSVTGDLTFSNNTFTNTSSTFLLVENYDPSSAGSVQFFDLDTDDDGVIDTALFDAVVDSVAVVGSDAPLVYSENVVGPDGSYLAAGAVRVPEATGGFEQTSYSDSSGYTPTAGSGGTGSGPEPTARLISEIQGTGTASLLIGEYVVVSAIVTYTLGNGFYIQEEAADSDGNELTSEGIFVYTGAAPTVDAGDFISVTGTVAEFSAQTQISNVTEIVTVGTGYALPEQVAMSLPFADAATLERYEGMRVNLSTSDPEAPLTVIENYNLARYGEVVISAGTQTTPTQLYDAQTQAAEIEALAEQNANNRIVIDDGVSTQNPDSFEFIPVTAENGDNGNGYLDAGDDFSQGATLRLGAQIDAPVEGILSEGFGDYRMLVDGQLSIDQATNSGAREASPADVGGTLQVASFNVLNYFTTIDVAGAGTGPDGTLDPRGADSETEFARQSAKIVAAMTETGAEVFALQEIENNGFGTDSAIATLVSALNAKAVELGTGAVYAYVDPGTDNGYLGTDAIMTGIIYDTTQVSLVHSDYLEFAETSAADTLAAADDLSAYGSLGDFQRNRPATAATFVEIASGEVFTVVSNHFKSKGDSGLQDIADAVEAAIANGTASAADIAAYDILQSDANFDQGNGQGFWNGVRTDAATELTIWLESDYASDLTTAGYPDTDYLLMGDFNAYGEEDPVQAVRDDAGYTDLIDEFIGQEEAYSYVFDGQQGTLDQALASSSLASQVTGLTEWHINADEPGLLNYDDTYTNSAFYNEDVFAASDHDPVIVGLDLGAADTFV